MTDMSAEPLRAVLDGRWGWVREMARDLAAEPLFHPEQVTDVEAMRERVLQQLCALADTRGARLGFPRAFGGEGDVGGAVTAFEMLAMGDLSLLVKAGVQWGLFGGAILHLGTRRHHDAYLRRVMELDLIGCFAMTETGHGSDVQSLLTTARFDPARDEFEIDTPNEAARKDYIGNAARDGRMAVVFAQLETPNPDAPERPARHGVHALLVPIRDPDGKPCPGVTIEDCGLKAGLNGVDNGRLWFDHVRAPRDNLLDRYGAVDRAGRYTSPIENETKRFFTMLGTLVQGRVSVAAGSVSAAKVAMTIAVRYAEVRRQFSPPGSDDEIVLLDYLVHQRRLLPRLARTYAMHFAQSDLIERLHHVFTGDESSEDDRRDVESRAAGIKALATWNATDVIQACREACGGAGYLAENRLPQLRADSDVFTTFEGDNTVLLQLVAKGLLTGFQDDFGDLDTVGMVRFVAGQLAQDLVEHSLLGTLTSRMADAVPGWRTEDLTDRALHSDLLEWRAEHVLAGAARRIKKGVDDGADLFEVFNSVQDHVLLAARTHVERQIHDCFVAAIEACPDPDIAGLLERVRALHVVSEIYADRGWFLEHGQLTPARAKELGKTLNALCAELRPRARLLVDAFGVPEPHVALGTSAGDG
jgi:acyl-CoA oxidase